MRRNRLHSPRARVIAASAEDGGEETILMQWQAGLVVLRFLVLPCLASSCLILSRRILSWLVLICAVLRCAVLCCAVLRCAALCCAKLPCACACAALCCPVLRCAVLLYCDRWSWYDVLWWCGFFWLSLVWTRGEERGGKGMRTTISYHTINATMTC